MIYDTRQCATCGDISVYRQDHEDEKWKSIHRQKCSCPLSGEFIRVTQGVIVVWDEVRLMLARLVLDTQHRWCGNAYENAAGRAAYHEWCLQCGRYVDHVQSVTEQNNDTCPAYGCMTVKNEVKI